MPDYEVFVQLRADAPHTHVGSVRAAGDELALQAAKEIYTRRDTPAGMWIVDRRHLRRFDAADADLFAIAGAKEYRQPSYYSRRQAELREPES